MMRAVSWIMALIFVAGGGALRGDLIPVTDRNVMHGLSPFNWVCTDDYISSTVCGASMTVRCNGTRQVALRVDLGHIQKATTVATRYPIIAWSVNGGPIQTHQLAAGETTVVLAADTAQPLIDLYIKGMSPFEDRYQGDVPGTAVKITGLIVDKGGTAAAVELPDKVWLNIGDSIMSGDGAAGAPNSGRPKNDLWAQAGDGRASYGYLLARHNGYREARLAYGGYDWAGGMAGLPRLATLIDQQTLTVQRIAGDLLRPLPDIVLINLGENGVPADKDVVAALGKIRSRINAVAKMIVMIPVSGKGRTEITRAFHAYQSAAKDGRAYLIDLGRITFTTCDGQHPTAAGHQAIYAVALPAFDRIIRRAEGEN